MIDPNFTFSETNDDIIQQNLFRCFMGQVKVSNLRNDYGPGMWNGKKIKELETCHLSNIVDMLRKRPRHHDEETQLSREAKIKEIQTEINARQAKGEKIIHSRHKLIFTEQMLLDYAKQLGISKGGIYFVSKDKFGNERATRIKGDQIQLRYDTQKVLGSKKVLGPKKVLGSKKGKKK